VGGVLGLLACCPQGAAAESAFALTDFIPETYSDLQWGVYASSGLGGDRGTEKESVGETHASSHGGRFGVATGCAWTHWSPSRWWTLGIGISGDEEKGRVDTDARYADADRMFPFAVTSSGSSRRSREEGEWAEETRLEEMALSEGRLYLASDLGFYLWRDLFLSGDEKVPLRYADTSNTEEEEEHRYSLPGEEPILDRSEVQDVFGIERDVSCSLVASAGWGRVYDGMFASAAVFMVDALRERGLMRREPDRLEMIRLASILYHNKLRHDIDERLADMEACQQVWEYLVDRGVAVEDSAAVAMVILDVWKYASWESRLWGWRVGLQFEWMVSRNTEETTEKEWIDEVRHVGSLTEVTMGTSWTGRTGKEESRSSRLTAFAQYRRPLGNYILLTLIGRTWWRPGGHTETSYRSQYSGKFDLEPHCLWDEHGFRDDLGTGHGGHLAAVVDYFPDTRTKGTTSIAWDWESQDSERLSWRGSETASGEIEESETTEERTHIRSTADLMCQLSYFIRPGLSLSGTGWWRWKLQRVTAECEETGRGEERSRLWVWSIRLGISYSGRGL